MRSLHRIYTHDLSLSYDVECYSVYIIDSILGHNIIFMKCTHI